LGEGLIGLTYSETREFQCLDAQIPVDEHGRLLGWEIDEQLFPSNQARWLELFKKHQEACEKAAINSFANIRWRQRNTKYPLQQLR
jgi:hypothetical protein